jgi:chromosome segregation and condensation protein ScpB
MARKLIAEDPRFGGRGRPVFLFTTSEFLRRFGLGSLVELPQLVNLTPRPCRLLARALGRANALQAV